MRDYELIKQHMLHSRQVAEQHRLLNDGNHKSVTTRWKKRLRSMIHNDNMTSNPTATILTPHHTA